MMLPSHAPTASQPYLSTHARYAAYTAERRGLDFRSLDGADGYLFEISDGARRALFACGAGSPYALNDARASSLARDKAFSAEALRQAGLPALPGEVFFVTKRWADMRGPGREPEDAIAYARAAVYPVFGKPIDASNGLYAELIADLGEFEDYMRRVAREHFAVLVQPYVRATEFRVFVLEGQALFSYRKLLPTLRGDGVSTLQTLLQTLPREHGGPPVRWRALAPGGGFHDGDYVARAGERIEFAGPANRTSGGESADLRDGAPAPLAKLALDAASVLGLGLAGVDIFDSAAGLQIIEVNSNPMIKTLEDHGRWDLIERVWGANIRAALE
jgi:glutathione synthase/RimK-type ligase-like ATP-grasp enzyme